MAFSKTDCGETIEAVGIFPLERPVLVLANSADTRTFRVAIRAPNNGHSLSAIFPVSPSPIADFGKEHLGTNFGKATPAGVRQRDRGSDVPAKRSYSRRAQSVKEAL